MIIAFPSLTNAAGAASERQLGEQVAPVALRRLSQPDAMPQDVVSQEVVPQLPAAQQALDAPRAAADAPLPLVVGERVELWLALRAARDAGDASDAGGAGDAGDAGDMERGVGMEWDVRLARVVALTPETVVLHAGGWALPDVAELRGARAAVRRFDADGLAEWEGAIVLDEAGEAGEADEADEARWADPSRGSGAAGAPGAVAGLRGAAETAVVVRLQPGAESGRLFQRRRSPRLVVGLTPVRLLPPEAEPDLLPVARLTDVSATGAGVVVDEPLSAGTTVTLEFELPGEGVPFAVRGRVVEPAVPIHGEAQPQADGLPGFRRGIEFTGTAANRESRRLSATLGRLLPERAE